MKKEGRRQKQGKFIFLIFFLISVLNMYKCLQKVTTLTLQMHMLQCGVDLRFTSGTGSRKGQNPAQPTCMHRGNAQLNFLFILLNLNSDIYYLKEEKESATG